MTTITGISPGTVSLEALARQFEMVQEALGALQRMRDELGRQPSWHADFEERFEALTDWLHDQLAALSCRAAVTKAVDLNELSAKARIWIERDIPGDDDIMSLARSICSDVEALVSKCAEPRSVASAHAILQKRRMSEFDASLEVVRESMRRLIG
jgi:hypothetical protein